MSFATFQSADPIDLGIYLHGSLVPAPTLDVFPAQIKKGLSIKAFRTGLVPVKCGPFGLFDPVRDPYRNAKFHKQLPRLEQARFRGIGLQGGVDDI